MTEAPEGSNEPQVKSGPSTAKVVVVVVGLLVAFAIGSSLLSDGGESEPSADDLRFAAFEVCREFVLEQLRSPSSAVFRNFFEDDGEVRVTGVGAGPYVVRSTVDSQNGFGAMLRSGFVCVVRNTSGDRWQLVDLSIE